MQDSDPVSQETADIWAALFILSTLLKMLSVICVVMKAPSQNTSVKEWNCSVF